jgi:hypothetical protein
MYNGWVYNLLSNLLSVLIRITNQVEGKPMEQATFNVLEEIARKIEI